jgi:ribose-phosphate pyrophosphokinase
MKIFCGNSNRKLAEDICKHLGVPLGNAVVRRFSDGEINVEINESVRGKDVFVIQSTCYPGNDNLMELLIMMDALKRASARRINAVIPYYGYARQDRKVSPRAPISAKLVADLITVSGATRMMTVDLHAGQIQGFFDIPVDHLYAFPVILDYLSKKFSDGEEIVIVSPDAGGVERARAFAKRLKARLAIIDKRREAANVSQVMNIIGEVEDMIAILLDDMIDTAGTLTHAAEALLEHGAREVYASASHPVLSGKAMERIKASSIREIVVTDTIPLSEKARQCSKFKVISVASLLAKAIHNIHTESSVSVLFSH